MEAQRRGRGRPVVQITLTEGERQTLERYERGHTVSQALALRSRIVLQCAEGRANQDVAAELGVKEHTVGKWRRRFAASRLDGLTDTPRPNVHRKLADERVEVVIRKTLETLPKGCTHWSTRKMADNVGVSQSSVTRIWRAFHLKPHRRKKYSISTDDLFTEKVRDIVGLYMNPPDNAVVLCVDEKTQVQALSRLQPVLPMGMGYHEGVTSSYTRHGTTNLLAALNVATGKVIGACYPRKRAIEFRQFLNLVDRSVPKHLEVELIVDNQSVHGAPEIQRWLKKHPRFHMHFTPTYSSWTNMVERWFGKLTEDALRRGHHSSVEELTKAIMAYVEATNDDPKPFVWTKTADEILASVARHCHRILGV